MTTRRQLPPIPLLGFTNATFGLMGGFTVVTLPEMLAAQGVPGGRIAAITSIIVSPSFFVFLLAPMLDVRFSRRAYALLCALVTACGAGYTVAHHTDLVRTEAIMFVAYTAASLYQGAVGGWVGSLIDKTQDGPLGVWFAVFNLGAGGLMMLCAGELIHRVDPSLAGFIVAALLMLPTLTFLAIPAPGPDRQLARESFRRFLAEILRLLQRREVLVALCLFVLPSASFALTNVLGGIGKDFAASEHIVSLCAGAGSAAAGVVGSLFVAPLAKRFPLRPLYLGIGVAGGLFTLTLLLLPHQPWTFALAITGENLFQAMAFAAANAIAFEIVGPANPLAATTFTLLLSASNLAVVYMSMVDGWGYTWRGVTGSYLLDAGVSITVCIALLLFLNHVRRGAGTRIAA